jgi:hypothetical protein
MAEGDAVDETKDTSLAPQGNSNTPQNKNGEPPPMQEMTYKAKGIEVKSQVSLGIEPQIHFAWTVEEKYWNKGFTLGSVS